MKVWILICLICVSLFAMGSEWKDFRILTQKNIFDPSRGLVVTTNEVVAIPPNHFTLVGTLSYERETWAFFDGTSTTYCKSLKLGDSIAGYRVVGITNDVVILSSKTNRIVLEVGDKVDLVK